VAPAAFGDKIVIRDDNGYGLFEVVVVFAYAYLLGYHVGQIIGDPGPHFRQIRDLYVYVAGFPPGGTEFNVQDFQFITRELPLKVGVYDGQFLEFFPGQAGKGGFKEICEDVLAAFVAEQEFEGNINFGEHEGHVYTIQGNRGETK
jgi:hypothetical protein